MNILIIILSVISIGFLIFIHELGHYVMGKKVKMKVEVFSIGFGKPIISWMRKGVKWQIAMFPFGGYVKFGGMQKENGVEPQDIPDGFFGAKSFDRLKVALMGPLVNIVFAFLAFSVIWFTGGRDVSFQEYTKKVGFVSPKSELYQKGLRAGDEIITYNGKPYQGYKDLLTSFAMNKDKVHLQGYHINYSKNLKVPFDYVVKKIPAVKGGYLPEIQIISAEYLFLKDVQNSSNPSIKLSQIKNNDRLLWVNGQTIFSVEQLSSILNENSVFLTVQRNDKIFHTNINLARLADLKTSQEIQNEIDDWKHFANLKTAFNDLNIIPYYFDRYAIVRNDLKFIDESKALKFEDERNAYSVALKKGDQILAINGHIIKSGFQLLHYMQNPEVLIIVQRDASLLQPIALANADADFDSNLNTNQLNEIVASIGIKDQIKSLNNLHLLSAISPITLKQSILANKQDSLAYFEAKNKIKAIKDSMKKEEAMKVLDQQLNRKVLGVSLVEKGRLIQYNPSPFTLLKKSAGSIYKTISSLITGKVNPKHIAGPIGMFKIIQKSMSISFLEGLYWLGLISLNLGILNLLPIPLLDGGYIIFALIEIITRKKIKAKAVDKLIIPFVVLLISFMLFSSFHDIVRMIKGVF